jgi:hypothetical protein
MVVAKGGWKREIPGILMVGKINLNGQMDFSYLFDGVQNFLRQMFYFFFDFE